MAETTEPIATEDVAPVNLNDAATRFLALINTPAVQAMSFERLTEFLRRTDVVAATQACLRPVFGEHCTAVRKSGFLG